jgi:hypothetical protein
MADPNQAKKDREVQLKAMNKVSCQAMESFGVSVGMKIQATVQLVKEYGLILSIPSAPELTGFIVNE